MRAFLTSPLVHFFGLGAALFLVFELRSDAPDLPPQDAIVLTPETARGLAERFVATWRRPPTAQELENLMEAWATEEAWVREALELGLDKDDAVIRQRLSHKLRFITEAQSTALVPDDAVLQAFVAENPALFTTPVRLSFEQVPVADDLPEPQLAALKQALQQGDATPAGPLGLLPGALEDLPLAVIDRSFGTGFGASLLTRPQGEWSGPVNSAYGRHMVRVGAIRPAAMPLFDEIREKALLEWQAVERTRLQAEAEAAIRARYDIILPAPEDVLP